MQKLIATMVFLYIFGQTISLTLENQDTIAATELTSALTKEEIASVAVSSTTGFDATSGMIFIGSEIVCYSTKTTTTFVTLTRGCRDTGASSHGNSTRVYNETAGVINTGAGFEIAETATGGGTLQVITALPNFFKDALPRLVAWDYSFFDGDLYGFPLIYLQMLGMIFSIAVIIAFLMLMLSVFQAAFRIVR